GGAVDATPEPGMRPSRAARMEGCCAPEARDRLRRRTHRVDACPSASGRASLRGSGRPRTPGGAGHPTPAAAAQPPALEAEGHPAPEADPGAAQRARPPVAAL